MAFALISNIAAGSGDLNTVTTGTLDSTGANLLIAVVSYYATGTNSVTDSKSNTWTKLTEYTNGAFNRVVIFYAKNPTVGTSHTFTASGASGSYPAIAVETFSGADTTAPFDQQNGTGSGVTPGSITPTTDNQLIITGLSSFTGTGGAPTIDSGFTVTDSHGNAGGAYVGYGLAYKIQTTAAAVNPTWTSGDTFRACDIASFKPYVHSVPGNLFRRVKVGDGMSRNEGAT